MTVTFELRVRGPVEEARTELIALRDRLGPYAAVWCPTDWRPTAGADVDGVFEIELQEFSRRADAREKVLSALRRSSSSVEIACPQAEMPPLE